jgi:hypothetical protein
MMSSGLAIGILGMAAYWNCGWDQLRIKVGNKDIIKLVTKNINF